MKHITVHETETAFDAIKSSLHTPQLAYIKSGDLIKCWSAPTVEMVDLGLSVKWAKYNIGSTHGTSPESWYGDYYAWGETETKDDYTDDNYTYSESPEILPSDHDAAAVKQGLRMPTKAELEELIALPNEWVTDYNNVTGLNGRVFRGNSNELFIPTAGFRSDGRFVDKGTHGYLWTRLRYIEEDDPDYTIYAWHLVFDDSIYVDFDFDDRSWGLPVRGVSE